MSQRRRRVFTEYIWLDDDKSEVSFHTSKAEEEQIMHTYCTLSTSLGPTRSPPLNLTPINEMSEEHGMYYFE